MTELLPVSDYICRKAMEAKDVVNVELSGLCSMGTGTKRANLEKQLIMVRMTVSSSDTGTRDKV